EVGSGGAGGRRGIGGGAMNGPRFGPELTSAGARFRLWAPAARSVALVLDQAYAMKAQEGGWYVLDHAGAHAGTRYKFRIDGEVGVPDPASGFQPEDASGPSEIIDHATYPWRAEHWRGRASPEAANLQLHVGTFTPARTSPAASDTHV